ncbi:unnamed protein product [Bursaphelenchus xylophilus]|uniref:(pine wood nematode) hypothetical protein n=1 Tax=Bursaphelenchus xylophilus TaxID=6326 RepID=A0A1I7SDE3_BURXY|nr:unnamed protein product [Bursaphelenchus xylophilus]CAG9130633.1 unnamed protein product [Bursaphelenchus xylophilus]
MLPRKSEAHRALELLEEYHAELTKTTDIELRKYIEKIISYFKSNLFQALCDIQDLYDNTLMNERVGVLQKISETRRFAERWENNPPFGGISRANSRPVLCTATLNPPGTNGVETTKRSYTYEEKTKEIKDGNIFTHQYATKTFEDPTGVTTQTTSANTLTDENGIEWEVEDVILEKNQTGLGFSISGGLDKSPAPDHLIRVTHIAPGGAVAKDGRIRVNDVIMQVNNTICENVNHDVAVKALQNAGSVVRLVVKRVKHGLGAPLPPIHQTSGILSSSTLPRSSGSSLPYPSGLSFSPPEILRLETTPGVKKIELFKDFAPDGTPRGIGVSIAGGIGNEHYQGDSSIYITNIIENTPAARDGRLQRGDQLLAVDDTVLQNVTHQFAVDTMKSTGNKVTLYYRRPNTDLEDSVSRSIGSLSHLNVNQPQELTTDPRWVVLKKGEGGLGFNIVGGEDGEPIYVSHVIPGGVADISNNVRKGDVLLQVNDTILANATHAAAAAALKRCQPNSNVKLLLQYQPFQYQQFEEKVERLRNDLIQQNQGQVAAAATVGVPIGQNFYEEPIYVRALFDNDPSRDPGVPPRALQFNYGDILRVYNRDDDDWWKARRVGDNGEGPEGVIPSKRRVEKREKQRRKQVNFNQGSQSLGRNSSMGGGGGLENRRGSRSQLSFSRKFPFVKSTEKLNELSENEFAEEPIFTYEVVTQQQVNYVRPVIILGALKDKINDELVTKFPNKFGSCVPHTSRPPRPNEIHGRDYYFVSKEEMERDVKNNLFIEAGQFQGNLYGTSIDAVRQVASEGKHCILDVSGNAIRRLRSTAGIYPVSVFIKPYNQHQLREWDPTLSDQEAYALFERCQRQEQTFGDLFTAVVTGHTFDDVLNKTLRVIQDQSRPDVWVPDNRPL